VSNYTDAVGQISRKPVSLVVISCKRCSLVYGVGACTAAASDECYNTWMTCQDRVNFAIEDYDLKFSSVSAAVVNQARPYVKTVTQLPTKLAEKLTVKARVKITMLDEESDDLGIDPYVNNRASVQGSYWKKFIARNPNYEGWDVKVYQGFTDIDEADYQQRWKGTLENILHSKGVVTLDTVDTLATIDKVEIPKIEAELVATVSSSDTEVVLTTIIKPDGEQIATSGYVQIEDEIIQYAGINVPANQLTGCTRGVFVTVAAAHEENERVSLVKYYAPDNPFDILQTIWDDAGGDYSADFDTAAWAYWRDWPKTDVDFSAIITEDDSADLAELFWEIATLLDVHIWQNEEQKISVMRKIGNEPGREYATVTDAANIIDSSTKTDYNAKSRKSRTNIYWGKKAIGDLDNPASFEHVSSIVDADAEGVDGYNGEASETIKTRWVSRRYIQEETIDRYVSALIRKRLFNRRDAQAITTISVDVRDEALLTGDNVTLSSDEILGADGLPRSRNNYIISRQKKGGQIILQLKELPRRRICFIAPAGHPDYNASLKTEQEYGYICNSNAQMPSDLSPGYHIY